MNDYPVRVGSMLYTLVDPRRGHEVEYNRWYERDHFYMGCMVGPWLFAGARWVATRELKDMRYPEDSPVAVPLDAGSYLATYWVHEGHHDDHFSWALEQVQWIYKNGRGFQERDHAHTKLFELPRAVYRDDDPVPLELAFDHRYAGLGSVFIERADGVDEDALVDFIDNTALPQAMAGSNIAITASWKPEQPAGSVTGGAPMPLGSEGGGLERTMQMLFLDADPRECWDQVRAYTDAVDASGLAKTIFAAPFLPTIVGTDTYTDQLW